MRCFAAWLVLIQNDGSFCATTGPVQPHIGLAGSGLSGLFQYLQSRFVSMQNGLLTKLSVQYIVNRTQPGIRGVQHPICHRLPGQLQSLAAKLLLQAVQRRIHHKLLSHDVSHSFSRCKAAGMKNWFFRRLQDIGFTGSFFALFAGVAIIDVLTDPELRRLHHQASVDFLANLLHKSSAGIAETLLIGKTVLHYFCRGSLRNDVCHTAGLPLALMGLHGNLFRGGRLRSVSISLSFIKVQAQLVHKVFLDPLGRRAKLALLGKT